MGVTAVESLSQFNDIIKKDVYTVFDFWATWCGPCRMISPVFEKLAEKSAEAGAAIEFYKVDVDSVADVAQEVGVRAMPTFVLFKNNEKVEDLVGANPGALSNLIAKAK
ncbi:thioredoxin [Phellopilus nigrolimitatus]|nr:thioredoxin [Phellopilus nigrolimitatus]